MQWGYLFSSAFSIILILIVVNMMLCSCSSCVIVSYIRAFMCVSCKAVRRDVQKYTNWYDMIVAWQTYIHSKSSRLLVRIENLSFSLQVSKDLLFHPFSQKY